jgi:hypothetical protein
LCVIAFVLRLVPAVQNRFHADEALFASWAMQVASGRDPLLTNVPLDKPPVSIYSMAASLAVFGRSEVAARLPNLLASAVSVTLVWAWARDLLSSETERVVEGVGVLSAVVMALSPFNITFGGTGFLDPLMVMWGLAACVVTGRGRPGWGGVFLGLAFATKAQGLLFAPLVVISAVFSAGCLDFRSLSRSPNSHVVATSVALRDRDLLRLKATTGARFLIGFGVVVVLVLAWSLARGGTPYWVQQTINYGGIRVAFPSEVGLRLSGWLTLFPYLLGPIAGVALLGGIFALLINAFTRGLHTRSAAIDICFIAYVLGFLALHWLLAFPIWDRYLLILAPVGAVLIERVSGLPVSRSQIAIKPNAHLIIFGTVALMLLPFSIQAVQSEIPIGGDQGARDGIDGVEAYLRSLPSGTVVYDHWLGWELDFYLWDAGVYRAYFETPADLARDLSVFGRTSARYVVFPAGESPKKVERAIGANGFALSPVLMTTNRFGRETFVVYQIASN